MFLENGLQMPHTGGMRCDRNKEENIRQVMMQNPRKSLSPYQQSRINHTQHVTGLLGVILVCAHTVFSYVKSTVYAKRPHNLADLRREIAAAFQQITPEMLRAT